MDWFGLKVVVEPTVVAEMLVAERLIAGEVEVIMLSMAFDKHSRYQYSNWLSDWHRLTHSISVPLQLSWSLNVLINSNKQTTGEILLGIEFEARIAVDC